MREMDPATRLRYQLAVHLSRKGHAVTAEQLRQWQDAATYGVWLDGKRIDNRALAGLQAEDIHGSVQSRLLPNAAHYGKYTYHLDVQTKASYAAHTAELRRQLTELDR